jgi:hypothetical protein
VPRKPTKPKQTEPPTRPKAGTSYPSAPTDPAERREHFRNRNALIQGYDPAEYMDLVRAQDARRESIAQRDPTGSRNHS